MESGALQACGDFLRALEVESLTKSLKLVTLKALLADGTLLSGAPIQQIAATARALVRRDRRLLADVASNGGPDARSIDDDAWIKYWRKNPIAAWTGEGSNKAQLFFRLEGERMVPRFVASDDCSEALCAMVSELVEWRLAAYLKNRRPLAPGVVRCKVSHSSGNPIVRFPDRGREALPSGTVEFRANGNTYEGDFQKIALNVAHKSGEIGNLLHALLRGWFGPVAGHSGTNHAVLFELVDGLWTMRPDAEAVPSASSVGIIVPLFPNYAVACGAFDHPQPETIATKRTTIVPIVGAPAPDAGDFLVFARGDSMDGGSDPIRHGDPLMLRWARGVDRRQLVGQVVLVRQGDARNAPTALKRLGADGRGGFLLRSDNVAAGLDPIEPTAANRIVALLVRKLRQVEFNPLATEMHRQYRREDIPSLYGSTYNPGNWNSGHVSLDGHTLLLVTLDKSEMAQGGTYHDEFVHGDRLIWSSQSSTSQESKRGRELLDCLDTGREIHLWVRRRKTDVVFTYCGLAVSIEATGDKPIRITWRLLDSAPAILLGK